MTLPDSTFSNGASNNRDRGVSIVRLVLVFLITIALFLVAMRLAQPVPVPELSIQSGTDHVKLEWIFTDNNFDGRVQYQHRSPTDDYPSAWTTMHGASEHVVTGLLNGVVYVFRVRAVSLEGIAGNPGNEVSVVPVGRSDDRLDELEARLSALATTLMTLQGNLEANAESLDRSNERLGVLEGRLTRAQIRRNRIEYVG